MKKSNNPFSLYLSVLLLTVFIAGCASTSPLRHYTLKPVSGVESLTTGHSIGLQPVIMPSWLDQSRISWVDGDVNQIALDQDRWAGPLSQIINQTLLRNFSRIYPDASVSPGPWVRSGTPERVITVRIMALERQHDELAAEIAITVSDQQRKVLINTFRTYRKSLPDNSPATEFAEALGIIMGQLSLDLAALL